MIRRISSASRRTTSACTERSTTTREPAAQIWPVFSVMPRTIVGIAASRSASAQITCGDLPPSSRCSGVRFLAQAAITSDPVSGDPVKLTRFTPRCAGTAAPASCP